MPAETESMPLHGLRVVDLTDDSGRFATRLLTEMGADVVYLVDSFGSFTPEEIKKYLQAIQSKTKIPLGFHGHHLSPLSCWYYIISYN